MRGLLQTFVFFGVGCSLSVPGLDSQIDASFDAPGSTIDASTKPNYAFVTSTFHTGDVGGVDGADAICAGRAAAANLPGEYVAWLSTSTISASDRLGGASGWIRPDGQPLAVDKVDLLSGRLLYAPIIDEFGDEMGNGEIVRTGTLLGGISAENNCEDWTSTAGAAEAGYPVGLAGRWTDFELSTCSRERRLYCFGTGTMEVSAPTVGANRIVFVSNGAINGLQGLSGMDSLCQSEASNAGQSGTFRALVATDMSSAVSRVLGDTSSDLVRVDGIPWANAPAELAIGNFTTSISLTIDMRLVDVQVWVGIRSFYESAFSGENCNNWVGNDELGAFLGLSSLQTQGTAGASTAASCASEYRLICGQE